MLKLTFSTLACPHWSIDQIIDRAAEYGYAGVDFRGSAEGLDHTLAPAFTSQLQRTTQKLRERGLHVPCLCSSVVLLTSDPAAWQAMTLEYVRSVALARALDCPFIRIFPGRTPEGVSIEEALALGHARAIELLGLNGDAALTSLLETHDDWNTAARLMRLIEGPQLERFGALWDVRHCIRGGESVDESIQQFGTRLKHVHLKDERTVGGDTVPALTGEGELPLDRAVNELRASGYDGWYCLEAEKRWRTDVAEPEEILPQFHAYMSRVLSN